MENKKSNLRQMLLDYMGGKSKTREQQMLEQLEQQEQPKPQPQQQQLQPKTSFRDLDGTLVADNRPINKELMEGMVRGFYGKVPEEKRPMPNISSRGIPVSDEQWKRIQDKISEVQDRSKQLESQPEMSGTDEAAKSVDADMANAITPEQMAKIRAVRRLTGR